MLFIIIWRLKWILEDLPCAFSFRKKLFLPHSAEFFNTIFFKNSKFFHIFSWWDPKPYLEMLNYINYNYILNFCPRIPKLVLKIILHKQMTELLSFKVNLRNGWKIRKSALFKMHFLLQKYFGPPKFLPHVKCVTG